MKDRTRSGPTRSSAISVAVLSLCVIIASRIERAGVVPVSASKTELPSVRTLSLPASTDTRGSTDRELQPEIAIDHLRRVAPGRHGDAAARMASGAAQVDVVEG